MVCLGRERGEKGGEVVEGRDIRGREIKGRYVKEIKGGK
jgi:hypothetical protein